VFTRIQNIIHNLILYSTQSSEDYGFKNKKYRMELATAITFAALVTYCRYYNIIIITYTLHILRIFTKTNMQVITKVKFNSFYNYYLNTTLRRPRRRLVYYFFCRHTEYDKIMATPTLRPIRPIYSMIQW